MAESAARDRILNAVAGRSSLSSLSVEERVVVNAEIDTGIETTAASADFAAQLAAEGVATVTMDADGHMIRRDPDGTGRSGRRRVSRLDLVVSPNGAGKSTFVRLVLAPNRPGTVFVNADLIARQRCPRTLRDTPTKLPVRRRGLGQPCSPPGPSSSPKRSFHTPQRLIWSAPPSTPTTRSAFTSSWFRWSIASCGSPAEWRRAGTTCRRTRSGAATTDCGDSPPTHRHSLVARRFGTTPDGPRVWSGCRRQIAGSVLLSGRPGCIPTCPHSSEASRPPPDHGASVNDIAYLWRYVPTKTTQQRREISCRVMT